MTKLVIEINQPTNDKLSVPFTQQNRNKIKNLWFWEKNVRREDATAEM